MTGALTEAVKGEQWELVALCLLLGMVRVLERLPPDALPALLDLIGEGSGQG